MHWVNRLGHENARKTIENIGKNMEIGRKQAWSNQNL
jgi:hypothetical protein